MGSALKVGDRHPMECLLLDFWIYITAFGRIVIEASWQDPFPDHGKLIGCHTRMTVTSLGYAR